MKLVMLIKMCLNETYSKVYIGKNLSDAFHIQNGLKGKDALSQLLLPTGRTGSEWNSSAPGLC